MNEPTADGSNGELVLNYPQHGRVHFSTLSKKNRVTKIH